MISQVTPKCQMVFSEKTCEKRYKTEWVNIIIEIYIFEIALIFKLKLTILDFWTKFSQKGYFRSKKEKNENYHWILHIWINLSTEFQLKLTILTFRTKFVPKGYFWSKREKLNTTMDSCIFELFLSPNFSTNWQFWVFHWVFRYK